jgi:hypothetical protein
MASFPTFLYLQLLDFLTTVLGFRFGVSEASPVVRILMHAGPVTGVALSKVVAVGLAFLCVRTGRPGLIRWATYWYSALIVWNLIVILSTAGIA